MINDLERSKTDVHKSLLQAEFELREQVRPFNGLEARFVEYQEPMVSALKRVRLGDYAL